MDRRKYQRLHLDIQAKIILFHEENKKVVHEGILFNMSFDGLGFQANQIFSREDLLEIEFEIEGQTLRLPAIVAWIEKRGEKDYQYGIKILDVVSHDLEKFRAYYHLCLLNPPSDKKLYQNII